MRSDDLARRSVGRVIQVSDATHWHAHVPTLLIVWLWLALMTSAFLAAANIPWHKHKPTAPKDDK